MSALLRSCLIVRQTSLRSCQTTVLRGPQVMICRRSSSAAAQPATIASRILYPFQRVHYFFKNDPFAKVSVIFGGVVLGILLVIEAFTKTAQKVKPQLMVAPPQCSHALVTRSKEITTLIKCLPSLTSYRQHVVTITGPSGSGKTVLATQLAQHFANGGLRIPFISSSRKPIVVSVDATNIVTLDYTLRYAASCLDIPSNDFSPADTNSSSQLLHFFDSIFTKLSSQKSKWLLVIDGVEEDEVVGVVSAALSSPAARSRKGCIVVTSNHSNHLPSSVTVSLDGGLTGTESSSLFHSLVGDGLTSTHTDSGQLTSTHTDSGQLTSTHTDSGQLTKLSQQLHNLPLAVSLAGLTVKLYCQFLEVADTTLAEKPVEQALSSFYEVLSSKLSSQPSHDELVAVTTQLYIEALSAADPFFLHAVDFLSSTNPSLPVPQSAISQHLTHPFYQLSVYSTQFLSPLADPLEPASPPPPPSYFEMIKSKIPFIPQSSSPLPAANGGQQALQKLAEAQTGRWSMPDPLTSLLKSPFIKSHSFSGLKLVSMHRSVVGCVHDHFLSYTVPKLEEAHVRGAKAQFDRGSWFKQFRSFDEDSVLASYLKTLPGLGEGGIMTEEQFKSASSSQRTYSEYLHMVSHNHRVAAALTSELKYLSRDTEDLLLCRYIQPHLSSLTLSPSLPANDLLKCQYGLLSIEAAFSPKSDSVYARYNAILQTEQRTMDPSTVANTLTQMAELKYHAGDTITAEQLLLSAVAMHNKVSRKSFEQSLDCGMTMSLLGLVYAAQGKKQLTKEYLERSLNLYQAMPVNGEVPRKQRKMVASTVTDLGHAYISLGNVTLAKRYLELALTAHRNIHPTGSHPELTRTLTVMSVVHALMGDHIESRRLRKEAQGTTILMH